MTPDERKMWIILKYGYDRNKVLKTKADILRAFKISRRIGRVIEPLGPYIIKVANDTIRTKNYVGYMFLDDMVAYAIMVLLWSSLKFDPSKSNNVYAYMVTCCHSACAHYLNSEKRQHNIKEELLDRVKHGQAQTN